eukprot:TRINITY_DN3913_c0_g1_i1.p1 TRINITY_DN3913_c0_g1~~TRINITY_DN3913_c0_g1_i1.p1  ORF type:complete len:508 (-),score=105.19 TRINITY_DN3913_c0_g1_i1:34-1464(-)
MDSSKTQSYVSQKWKESVIPTLEKYISIPNQSPAFDPEWSTNGLLDQVVDLFVDWVKQQNVPNLALEVLKEQGRTPLISVTVPATPDCKVQDTIMMYGHLDKQPPLTEQWAEGISPYKPLIKDGKLFGRGSADDGYAIFSAITAIKAAKEQGASHTKICVIIEAGEESGSVDLSHYVEKLKASLGNVGLIICLDSGCGNYEQFWLTTSLRGIAEGTLKVKIMQNGVHSGDASGVVPSTFRIARFLLDRLEDSKTGEILLKELYADIPQKRIDQAKQTASFLGDVVWNEKPFVPGARAVSSDNSELVLNRTWKPQLAVIGANGLPSCTTAGNVLRSETQLQLSIRLPPTVNADVACKAIKAVLEKDPPYGAQVIFVIGDPASGWASPILADWLEKSINDASTTFFKKPALQTGEGGSIPFMGMLGEMFPQAQFVITGVLGPGSNAHGPNEFLHIDYSAKVTCCVSHIIQDFYKAKSS